MPLLNKLGVENQPGGGVYGMLIFAIALVLHFGLSLIAQDLVLSCVHLDRIQLLRDLAELIQRE
jgi:hypothetical protein